jgi:hypothetical protein
VNWCGIRRTRMAAYGQSLALTCTPHRCSYPSPYMVSHTAAVGVINPIEGHEDTHLAGQVSQSSGAL